MTKEMGNVECEGEALEWVRKFVYLGNEMECDGDAKGPVQYRLALGSSRFKQLLTVWKDKQLDTKLKIRLYKCAVCSVMRYGSDAYTLGSREKAMINGWNSRKLAVITGRDIGDEARTPTYNLVNDIIRQRATWTGHILRMDKDSTIKKVITEIYEKGEQYDGAMLHRDTLPTHKSIEDLIAKAEDRAGWNKFVKTLVTRDSSTPKRGKGRSLRRSVRIRAVNKMID